MKRFICLMLVLAMAAFALVGCDTAEVTPTDTQGGESQPENTEDAPGKKYRIGFSVQDISEPSWASMLKFMEKKADEIGVELTLSDCKGDQAKQIDSLENFIQGGYDAIIVIAFTAESVSTTLQEAKDKGIKIIAFDTYVEEADSYFGLDNYDAGKLIASHAADYIAATFPEDEKVEVGICNYPLNQVCLDREEGIEDGLAEYAPNAVVVARAQAGYIEEGIKVGEIFMQAHPNMKVICGIDDAGLLGVYESMKAANFLPEDFGMFGIDALEEAIQLIAEGSIFRSTIHLDLDAIGEQMVQTAKDLIEGKEVVKTTYFPTVHITIENASEYLDN